MQDYNFGQLWVDGLEPDNYDFLFASNMTLKNRVNDLPLADDYYDYIIIDEVHHENKQCLTVLDFVGNARAEYNFESRFRAMIGRSNMSIKEEIEEGFVHLPLGCTIVLEKQAQSHILNNIKSYVSFNKNMILARIRNFKNETNLPLTLSNFLKITHIPFRRIYNWDNKSWVTLCMDAGVLDLQELLFMKELSRAVRKKWLSADSYSYFSFLHENLIVFLIFKFPFQFIFSIIS